MHNDISHYLIRQLELTSGGIWIKPMPSLNQGTWLQEVLGGEKRSFLGICYFSCVRENLVAIKKMKPSA